MESPQGGGKHRVRVTTVVWQPWSHHRRVETMEVPWEGGNHRVTTGGWKLGSDH